MVAGAQRTKAVLRLPCLGPEPMGLDRALDAVVGYARATRWLRFRSPGSPEGRWAQVPAFGWTRFDARPASTGLDADVLLGEGLHGRLDRAGWHDVHDTLDRTAPLVDALVARADGSPLWAQDDDELSVLGEPGTIGALLRQVGHESGPHAAHVLAALHHRHPALVPHLTRTTRRTLLPHLEEGDSGVEAVVRRDLRANDDAFAELEAAVATAIGDARPTRLRLHDVLLWLSTTLRLAHAEGEGRRFRDPGR
ncbi:hypothetical protein Acsp06_15160 [Actinomycetospora sp. NBRC 106375]|uniref:hypothetical protein n=1 Tax=Actinomycetospora sp. NBRC 106375 TaxID=3032207 RepID=UPI0024A5BBD7|nr:hypothetical protein [Actinomycetospora sp. NBRC 106375]GLZ45331.1 hypothetical protein Acsp06_15160 [Actinomycetospora sp. NBRC 106375]